MEPKIAIGGKGYKSCRLPNTVGLATGTICTAGFDEHHSGTVQRAHVRPLINEYLMTNYSSWASLVSLLGADATGECHSQQNPD